jgi:hypothetical protein
VKRGLYQPDSGCASFVRSIYPGLHEPAANAEVLCAGINRDWAYTCYYGPLVETITAYDPAFVFGHHTVKTGR